MHHQCHSDCTAPLTQFYEKQTGDLRCVGPVWKKPSIPVNVSARSVMFVKHSQADFEKISIKLIKHKNGGMIDPRPVREKETLIPYKQILFVNCELPV